uniref:Peptidase S8/S53 domain-containing protein n=1 Tax=Solanum lycopersicum TaxID=4081 RepID=K4CYE9_SOLLC
MGPIPSRWKGICKSEANFNATIHCNKKKNWLDASGHGSHCASTAAGSYVNNLQYYGLNMGTIRGGAPLARLAYIVVYIQDNNILLFAVLKTLNHSSERKSCNAFLSTTTRYSCAFKHSKNYWCFGFHCC